MRYRLLKELPLDIVINLIADTYYLWVPVYCVSWAKEVGDRDLCRENATNYEHLWAKNIGDIEFMKNSLKASDSVGKGGRTRDKRIKEWNNTYRGTKYEISTI